MSLLCGLSGQVAAQPVLNPKSGRVYEKHLIEQHLLTSQTDPHTHEPLSASDLVPISLSSLALPPFLSSPSPSTLSLSSLLSSLQREFDGVMLEQFSLKREVHSLKQELAHALYQYDAACRVIARLIRERDDAQAALLAGGTAERKQQHPAAAAAVDGHGNEGRQAMDVEGEKKDGGASAQSALAEMTAAFEETSERLGGKRRKAAVKDKAAAAARTEDVAQYSVTQSFTLHGAATPGVTAVDVDLRTEGERLLVTGGADGSVIVFDAKAGKVRDTLHGHKKRVTAVAFVQQASFTSASSSTSHLPILSSSADHSVQLYTFDTEAGHYASAHVWMQHTAAVTGLSLHPSAQFFATSSLDSSYLIHSLASASPVLTTATPSPLTSLAFHPDGRILATTHQDKHVRIYDALASQCVVTFTSHTHAPSALSFSPNGWLAASGDDGGVVRLWDLRKVSGEKESNVATVVIGEGKSVGALSFDDGGGLLSATVGAEVVVVETKGHSEVARWREHKDDVRGLRWGQHAHWFVTASKDRTVRLWGAKATSA